MGGAVQYWAKAQQNNSYFVVFSEILIIDKKVDKKIRYSYNFVKLRQTFIFVMTIAALTVYCNVARSLLDKLIHLRKTFDCHLITLIKCSLNMPRPQNPESFSYKGSILHHKVCHYSISSILIRQIILQGEEYCGQRFREERSITWIYKL